MIHKSGISKILTIAAFILLPLANASAGTISMQWHVDSQGAPINELLFKLKFNQAKPRPQFYYAYQFGFTGGGHIGYIGMQPDYSKHGERRFKVLFSSFRKGTKVLSSNCHPGADYGPGATCRIHIPANYGSNYELRVTKHGDVVTGVVRDTSTGKTTTIGKWRVDSKAGNLSGREAAWVENYVMTKKKKLCTYKGWPYYEVKYFAPIANGSVTGTISTPNHGSDSCPGAVKWKVYPDGLLLKGGFHAPKDQRSIQGLIDREEDPLP